MTTTRLRRRERTRAAILESARELILELRAEKVSLRGVAARAEYSPAGLYRYFKDKEELVAATAEQALESLAAHFAQAPVDLPPRQMRGVEADLDALHRVLVTAFVDSPGRRR